MMSFSTSYLTFWSLFLLSSTSVSALPKPASEFDLVVRQIPSLPCATGVHVIAASGDGAANIGGYGLIGSLSTSILNAIPGSTNVTLPYPKADEDGLHKTIVGSQNLITYLNQYYGACPESKIVLLGYSAGGIITMNTLCGGQAPWPASTPLSGDWTRPIIGTVIYGDETHTAEQSYNRGTCTGSGRFPRANTDGCAPFAPYIQSYCNAEDPQCCGGFVPDAHFTYPTDYDGDATAFIVSRYQDTLGDGTSSSSTTTTSAAPTTTSSLPTSTLTLTSTSTSTLTSTTTAAAPAPPTTTEVPPPAATTTPAGPPPVSGTSDCPADINGDYQFPHFIVPVKSCEPDTALGMNPSPKVDVDTSTLFNFDIPNEYAGKTCTVIFLLPNAEDLVSSSFTTSGAGGISVAAVDLAAGPGTTYNNRPSVTTDFGVFNVTPGSSTVISTGPCVQGTTQTYQMSANGDYALEYFQNTASPAIGLYIRAC